MKPVLQAVLFLGLVAPSFSAVPVVDFDGKHGKLQNITTFLQESQEPVAIPLKADTEPVLVKKAWTTNETGDLVEVKPIKVWRGDDGIVRTQYTYWPDVKIVWSLECKGTSQPTWNARESYTFTSDQDAGHLHYGMPPLKVSTVYNTNATPPASEFYPKPNTFYFPTMTTNVKRYYWEWMPLFATTLIEEFQSLGACTGNQVDIIDVKVPGLSEMPKDPNYILYRTPNTIQYHPKCHNGTPALQTTLKTIADNYKAAFPNAGPVEIFHMSLPWGGKFDLENGWGAGDTPENIESHEGHKYGIEADIRKVTVPKANRRKLLEIMCAANTKKVYSEIPSHYHIRTITKAAEYPESLFAYEKSMITCCEDGVINEDNMAACISD